MDETSRKQWGLLDSPSFNPTQVPNIYRVAITGGPCGGKTTALAEVAERLRTRGFGAFVVPEAATLLFTGGASLNNAGADKVVHFQSTLLRTQMALEDAFIRLARDAKRDSVVLCDRGTLDGRAYMTAKMWSRMLEENKWDPVRLRDGRYDLVIHLVTAADGAEEFYTTENNAARDESTEEAIQKDRKTQNAWVGHPHLRIVDNRSDFTSKINRVFSLVAELIGVQKSSGIVRKFLVQKGTPALSVDGLIGALKGIEDFDVEQTFLKRAADNDEDLESVRVRRKGSAATFVHKVWQDGLETKRQITNREYISLLAYSDPDRRTVRIRRQCFLYGRNYFIMDTIKNVYPLVQLVRCHCEKGSPRNLEFPQWLHIEREVTGEDKWTIYAMSQKVTPIRIHTGGKAVHNDNSRDYELMDGALAKSL